MKLFKKNTKNSSRASRHPSLMPGQSDGYAFRRSRTLTGTTSVKVAATAERNSQLKTARLQVHELHQRRRRILRLLAGCGLAVALLSLLMLNFIGTPVIVAREPAAAALPRGAAYLQSADEYFHRNPLQRFGIFLNNTALESFILARHSELKQVSVATGLSNARPVFTVEFRRPVLVWETGGQRFFVDGNGVAFRHDYYQGEYVAVADQSGIDVRAGGSAASGRFIAFLGQLVGAVSQTEKGRVVSIGIPSAARQVDLRLQGRDYVIKTYLDREPRQQAEDIGRAIAWFDARSIKPQYIDVRVTGKAFYK